MSAPPANAGRTVALALLLAFFVLVAFVPGAFVGGEALSQADYLLEAEPWRAVAPPGHVPGNPSLSDQTTQFVPWRLYTQRRLADGALPWWNPYSGAGEPFVANLQSGVFSPWMLAYLWGGWPFGLLVVAIGKTLLAAAGMALLLARLGVGPGAALLGAVAFAFCGFQVGWLGHPHSGVSAFLPMLLYLTEAWMAPRARDARSPWLVPTAFTVCVAAMMLSGHVETALHVSLAVALWALVRALQGADGSGDADGGARAPSPPGRRVRLLAGMLAAALVGVLVAGIQYAPFSEYLLHSSAWVERRAFGGLWKARPEVPLDELLAALVAVVAAAVLIVLSLDASRAGRRRRAWAGALLAMGAVAFALRLGHELGLSELHRLLFWPDRFGHPVPARGLEYAGPRAYVNVNGGYVGLASLGLALVALAVSRRRHAVVAFGALWLLAFVVAFEVPVLAGLVEVLPGLSSSLNDRLTLVLACATAGLAALGLDALVELARAPVRDARGRAGPPPVVTGTRPAPARARPGDRRRALTLLGIVIGGVALANVRDQPPVARRPPPRAARGGAEPVAPAPGPPFGELAPIAEPHRGGVPLVVHGWAFDDEGPPDVRLELWQRDDPTRRTVRRIDATDLVAPRAWPPPSAFSRYPGAGRCGLAATLALDDFDAGRLWLRATLIGRDGVETVVYDQSFRYLPERPPRTRWWVLGGAALALLLGALLGAIGATPLLLGAHALLLVDLFLFGHDLNPTTPTGLVFPDTPVTDFLAAQPGPFRIDAAADGVLPPNTAMPYGLEDVRRYDAIDVDGYTMLLEMLRPEGAVAFGGTGARDVAHPFYPMLGVRFLLAPRAWEPPPGLGLEVAFEHGAVRVWRDPREAPRAVLVPEARTLRPYLEALPDPGASPRARRRHLDVARGLGAAARAGLDWRRLLVIDGPGAEPMPRDLASLGPLEPPIEGGVTLRARTPERIELEVDSPRDAWLLLAETWMPGWRATVDGEPAAVARAFFAFRAVRIPPGRSRVVLAYRPTSIAMGAGASALGLVGLFIVAFATRRRLGRDAPPPR